MSTFSTICDYVIADLQANVTSLNTTNVPAERTHRYYPANPEEQAASSGERHLGVWPEPEAETAERFTTNGNLLTQNYVVVVWEDASETDSMRRANQTAEAALLDLAEAVRARFHRLAAQTVGGAFQVDYRGILLPGEAGLNRWFAVRFVAFTHLDVT
jgi:hypothetical protein